MKKLVLIFFIAFLFTISNGVFSQVPPPPPDNHGDTGNNNPGGGAPIGSGVAILLGLAVAYGGKKVYDLNKEELEE